MSTCRFVQHKGFQIFEMNWDGLDADQVLLAIEEAKRVVPTQPKNSVLALTSVVNAQFDGRVNKALREMTSADKDFVRRSAVVGVSGAQQMILSGIRILTRRDIRGFDDTTEAMDWLIRD